MRTMVFFEVSEQDIDNIHGRIQLVRMPRSRTIDADALRFGRVVRRLRNQRGWTIRKLATRAGMTAAYLGILEQGGNVPSLSTVLELIEVLNGDIGAVMTELSAARNAPATRSAASPASAGAASGG